MTQYKALYLAVTADKLELPIAVADSKAELARMLHISTAAINHRLSRNPEEPGKNTGYKIVVTLVDFSTEEMELNQIRRY